MKKIIDRNHKDFEQVLDKVIQHMNKNGVKIDNVDNFKKDVKQLILHEDKTLEIVGTGN
ncbi:MAG: hypothetical protein IJR46_04075 [Neisseriaceae bacterium]|nr:hypothetical protein [Neisseriaceae bacterium]